MMTQTGRVVYDRKQHAFREHRISMILKSFGEDQNSREYSRTCAKIIVRSIEELKLEPNHAVLVLNGVTNYLNAYRRTWYEATFFGWLLRLGRGDPDTTFYYEKKKE